MSSFTNEVKIYELVARHLWPLVRPMVRRHLTPRCSHCILSHNYKPLDAEGVCPECREFAARRPQSNDVAATKAASAQLAEQFDALVQSYAGGGAGDYDALVLFSGGKDSAYLLHTVRARYPELRVLTFLVHNGFMSPAALSNAERIIAKFDVDHIVFHLPLPLTSKMFRHALMVMDEGEKFGAVDRMDGHLTFDVARNFAARNAIPLIVTGLSKAQVQTIWNLDAFELPRTLEREKVTKRCGIALNEIFSPQEMRYWWDGTAWPEERVPRFLMPFYAWAPEEAFILDEVVRLGLVTREQSSPLVTNSELIPVLGIVEMSRFGYCTFEPEFAKMVREGDADRRFWINVFEMLEYSAKTGRFIGRTVDETLTKLNLSRQQLGIRY